MSTFFKPAQYIKQGQTTSIRIKLESLADLLKNRVIAGVGQYEHFNKAEIIGNVGSFERAIRELAATMTMSGVDDTMITAKLELAKAAFETCKDELHGWRYYWNALVALVYSYCGDGYAKKSEQLNKELNVNNRLSKAFSDLENLDVSAENFSRNCSRFFSPSIAASSSDGFVAADPVKQPLPGSLDGFDELTYDSSFIAAS